MEKKKSRCMALDCCCYFIPASALLFGFYQQVGVLLGVKIDFFDRDDAQIIPQYENLAKACAERHLMVDFHGCSKPTGLHRAYPNILLMKPCDVRSVLSGIPLLIRIISFNVSLPVCWEVELIILRGRCVTAHWKI